jgi:hypothetical protein
MDGVHEKGNESVWAEKLNVIPEDMAFQPAPFQSPRSAGGAKARHAGKELETR